MHLCILNKLDSSFRYSLNTNTKSLVPCQDMVNGNARPYNAKFPGVQLRASCRTFGRPVNLRACEHVMKLE